MKRITSYFIFAMAALFMMSVRVDAAELEPSFDAGRAVSNKYLTDSDYGTSVSFKKGEKLKVTAKDGSPIKAYYVIWNDPISEYTVDTDNGVVNAGSNGFIHEYVNFEKETSAFTINIPSDNLDIAKIRIFSDDEVPDDVQVWNPPCEKADILLISSHADDEILFFGGIIPTYAVEENAQLQVAYMTEFYSSTPVREHEKLDGLWVSGLKNYPVCGNFYDVYSDSLEKARTQYDEDAMVDFIAETLDRFQPQVVVTHDVKGEYGHGFHMLTNDATTKALDKAIWQVPKTYYHLWKENQIKLDFRHPIDGMGGKTALEIATEAYKQHVSQQWCWFYVSDDYEYSCAEFGLFRSLVGEDDADDIMCNLKTYAEQEEERLEEEAAADPTRVAKELTPVIETIIFPQMVPNLSDGMYETSMPFLPNDAITVKSAEGNKIKGVYIQWDSTPCEYIIETDGGNLECGKNGFLHEYIEFDKATSKLRIVKPEQETSVAEIRIFTAGRLPEDVQVWELPCDKADIMIVTAHSDDELIFMGGIIPVYVDRGCAIEVVYMTECFSTLRIREHEKLDGLWTAGIRNYPVCGNFYDHKSMDYETAKGQYDFDEMTAFLTQCYNRFQPQVVVTHDENGEYGHGYHVLTSEAVRKAVEIADWQVPKTYIHLWDKGKIELDLRQPIASRGGKTAIEIVADAYSKHVSQKDCGMIIDDEYQWSCARFGLFRTLVGKDKDNDIMSNLTPYANQNGEQTAVVNNASSFSVGKIALIVLVILALAATFGFIRKYIR